MKWEGADGFRKSTRDVLEFVRVAAARRMMEIAKAQRDMALEGFWTYKIGLRTGRSRALYAIKPDQTMFTRNAVHLGLEVGYTDWPDHDKWWPTGPPLEFYPVMLDRGTTGRTSRPFHTAAVDFAARRFYREMPFVIDEAFVRAVS